MSKYEKIENNLSDSTETAIVSWIAGEENTKTIAIVNHATKNVEYIDKDAVTDLYAQRKINEVLMRLI